MKSPSQKQRVSSMAVIGLLSLSFASVAGAVAYTKDVYPPERHSTTLQGWANLGRDCTNTNGCWNYMKIEQKTWYGSSFIGGTWAGVDGWNSVSAPLSTGCEEYRTTVDSYNDIAGTHGIGINLGEVGVSADGTKIYRYQTTWSSGYVRYCR
jgi:hypothetical protein